MGKGGSAPRPDPNIGVAAMKSAELGQSYLDYMMGQSDITNKWAEEDRSRYKGTFQPLEDAYIKEAQNWDSPERMAAAESAAVADVRQQANIAQGARARSAAAMGIDPRSGRYQAEEGRAATAEALGAAGASNAARKQVMAEAEAKTANAINMGKGLAVNPGTSMQISNGASSNGFSGAMSGLGQQGQLLNTQYQGQLQSYQASQQASGALGSALGSVAGAWMMSSSKDAKTNKRKVRGVLDAVKSMPVEKWSYKEGEGDGGEHIGPYAEDFQKSTGMGDGKRINVIDMLGVTMGAVKELAAQVDEMGADAKPRKKAA